MCETCFRLVAPDVAEALLRLQSITSIRTGSACAHCGELLRERFAGNHYGDPLCFGCFFKHAPEVAALLRLHEAALEAADNHDALCLLDVAVSYAKLLHFLDSKYPRDPPSR